MNRWIRLMLGADFFLELALAMLVPVFAIFVLQVGGGILEVGEAWAAFSIVAGVLTYYIGKWEDHNKHYLRLLIIGYIFRSTAFLGYFFVENLAQLILIQIVLGISFAITSPAYDTLYSLHLEKGHIAKDWASWEAMNSIVEGIGALIGAAIVAFFGFKVLFLIMFLSGIVGVIIASLLLRKNPSPTES